MQTLTFEILPQPDDVTCGPTCLHAVYGYYGDLLAIEQVIEEVTPLDTRGTLAVFLGQHALSRGYRATLFTYNLEVFDPTWFRPGAGDLADKLLSQAAVKADPRVRSATAAYLRFLEMGGELRHEDLSPELIHQLLKRGPVLTGLSATYLYACAREVDDGTTLYYDDLVGEATGHFVVLYGYHAESRGILVADPLRGNPLSGEGQHYVVPVQRLIGAILLGVITYDGNMLLLERPVPE